jgi:hypothetical protein
MSCNCIYKLALFGIIAVIITSHKLLPLDIILASFNNLGLGTNRNWSLCHVWFTKLFCKMTVYIQTSQPAHTNVNKGVKTCPLPPKKEL